jgi:hypothetical protein
LLFKQEDENQSEKNVNGRFVDTDDTLHTVEEKCTEDEDNDADADRVTSELYECYYCEKFLLQMMKSNTKDTSLIVILKKDYIHFYLNWKNWK